MFRSATLVAGAVVLASASQASAQPASTWHPASPANYTASSGRTIDLIVIHKAEGSADSAWSWFQNPAAQASAHYVVADDGSIDHMVQEKDIAWHAGNWDYNVRSIGIENEGYAARNDMSDVHYRALAELVSYLCDKYGIPKDRAHIIGHNEVPDPFNPSLGGGAGHHSSCPGPHFDWALFMQYVGGSPPPPPPPPPPPSSGSFTGLQATTTVNIRDAAWGNILGQAWSGLTLVGTGNEDQGFSEVWFGGGTAWIYTAYLADAGGTGGQVSVDTLDVRYDTSLDPSTIVGEAYSGQTYTSLGVAGSWRLIQFDTRREWVWADYTSELSLN